jgi:hypothetical protein
MKGFILIACLFNAVYISWADWNTPVNLGPGVNTSLYDYAPSLSVSGDTLYFARAESNGVDYNIYRSVFRGGAWDSAVSVGDSVNSTAYGEGAPFISYSGSRLYFTKWPANNHNDYHIYYNEKRNGVWQGAKRFEAAFNNDQYPNSWPCFTHDGRRLFFYSFGRPGGSGLGDLWYSDYDTVTQAWGPPVNLGDSINTPDWDGCPALSWDDRTLYFNSARAPTYKTKIYKSVMVNGVWQGCTILPAPINYPIGSSQYPCLSADGMHLFFGGIDVPLPSYGLLDIYDSRWVVGVESPPVETTPTTALKIFMTNPLRTGAYIRLLGGSPSRSVEAILYDLQGRRLRFWPGNELRAKRLLWDGKDGFGNILASGVYFLEFKSDLERAFSKAVVIR